MLSSTLKEHTSTQEGLYMHPTITFFFVCIVDLSIINYGVNVLPTTNTKINIISLTGIKINMKFDNRHAQCLIDSGGQICVMKTIFYKTLPKYLKETEQKLPRCTLGLGCGDTHVKI